MPGSVAEGKDLVREFCVKNDVHSVLDIGPGEGTYYHALQGVELDRLDGIEVWGPYLDQYDLWSKYNHIYISDIYYFDFDKITNYDMIILGDVIEHMPEHQGKDVIIRSVLKSKWVVVSLPIYGYYQEVKPGQGNTYETHVEQYSDESIRELIYPFEIIESLKGNTVGVYIIKGHA